MAATLFINRSLQIGRISTRLSFSAFTDSLLYPSIMNDLSFCVPGTVIEILSFLSLLRRHFGIGFHSFRRNLNLKFNEIYWPRHRMHYCIPISLKSLTIFLPPPAANIAQFNLPTMSVCPFVGSISLQISGKTECHDNFAFNSMNRFLTLLFHHPYELFFCLVFLFGKGIFVTIEFIKLALF